MFEGAIYLRFTFGVCPFYSDLTHRTGLNLKEKKVVTQYNSNYIVLYTPPPSFLAQIESDPCSLTVLFDPERTKMTLILGRLIKMKIVQSPLRVFDFG